MRVFRSNRAEVLARILASVLSSGAGAILDEEPIVVQSRGMERWLSLFLASELGVWFGVRFPFPRAFIDEVMASVLGEESAAIFSRENLTFCVAGELVEAADRPELAAVADYLRDDQTGRDLLALAARIADLFDQYAVYRPDLVLGWEQGEGDEWQAILWRAVMARLRSRPGIPADAALHVAGRRTRFGPCFRALPDLPASLPRRVSLFGIASLPPVYLEILAALAERIEVNLFLLSPSREHVAELCSSREILRELRRADDLDAVALHLWEGNPLLARLGQLNREFEEVLEQTTDYQEPAGELFVDPGIDTLLHAVQHDILHLVTRRPQLGQDDGRAVAFESLALPPLRVADEDWSIEIHACHGPLREVEVLHDVLRAAFEADPTLEPHDVLVMAPRIELFAPLIEAVFGTGEGGAATIPYQIADRSAGDVSPTIRTALGVLAVLAGRFSLSEVAGLLEAEPIQARFGIEAAGVPRVLELLMTAGVRWGVDATDRSAHGAPPVHPHTWSFGLERLLLGYAMPGGGHELFAGVAPVDGVEGDTATLVGQVNHLVARLVTWRERWLSPRPIAEHASMFWAMLPELLDPGPAGTRDLKLLGDVVAALGESAAATGFVAPIPLEVFRDLVVARLPELGSNAGYLTGGVTFSALLPMRSVPFRVVCLLGMNDGDFPRARRRTSFDRMLDRPRPGDRSLRREDENLFLEVLLSARERLVITYSGRSMHDDTVRAPSVAVGDLIEVLDEAFVAALPPPLPLSAPDGAIGVGSRRVVHHAIQRFSLRCFASGAATHDVVAAAGARALSARSKRAVPFLAEPLPPRDQHEFSIEELVDTLVAPARALLRRRLGVDLDDHHVTLRDGDPIDLDSLERWEIGHDLLTLALSAPEAPGAAATWEFERARGRLPLGAPGRSAFEAIATEVTAIVHEAQRHRDGECLAPVPITITVAGGTVVGLLEELWPAAQVAARFTREGGAPELEAWVRHLALQIAAADARAIALPRRTVLVGRPSSRGGATAAVFRPLEPEAARSHLAELVELCSLAWRVPLPFFPRAARTYAKRYLALTAKGKADAGPPALAAARREFGLAPRWSARPANADPYVVRLFGDTDPLGADARTWGSAGATELLVESFAKLALLVYGPLLAARGEEDGDEEGDEEAGS